MTHPETLAVGMLGGALVGMLVVAVVFGPEVAESLRRLMVEAKSLYLEAPLRLATGRHRPDYAAIARMEREHLPHTETMEP